MILTFLFATPVWVILILINRSQKLSVKLLASIIGIGYAYLCFSMALGRPFVSQLVGPAKIEFGTAILNDGTDVRVANLTSQFDYPVDSLEFAWVAHLGVPVGTTTPRLVLSQAVNGGEQVIAQTMLTLADSNYTIVYGQDMRWTGATLYGVLPLQRGVYVLRLMAGDTILARGEFSVQ